MIDYTLFNSDKSLMRCSTEFIPSNTNAFKDSGIPFAVTVRPYGEAMNEDGTNAEVPPVHFKNDPIVRCKDCRAYINPFVRWV
jgi:protein transport protein SEC24